MNGKNDKDNRTPDRKARDEAWERIWGRKQMERDRRRVAVEMRASEDKERK